MIVGSQRRAIITVNSRAIPVRRRYSLAHEIGHWHHHRGKILFCAATDIDNPVHGPLDPETQADQFASDLLLPDFMFRARVGKMKRLVLATEREIAVEFSVSLTATLLKLVKPTGFRLSACATTRSVGGGSGRLRWCRNGVFRKMNSRALNRDLSSSVQGR
jgi:Zn-dependent peptidase ImmA (M78 family)